MATIPPSYLDIAKGALELRKQRNRKRTVTGEYVWSEEADLVFALGLIEWTRNPSCRAGERRSFFLERFLRERGIIKTRKQIASRLQVLKGEWSNTPYQDLLRNPEDTIEMMRGSITPPLQDHRTSSSNSPPTAKQQYHSRAMLQSGSVTPDPSTTYSGLSVSPLPYSESRQSSHGAYNMSSYGAVAYAETRAEVPSHSYPHSHALSHTYPHSHRYTGSPYSSSTCSGSENAGSYTPQTDSVQWSDYHVNLSYGMPSQHDVALHREYYPGLTDTPPSY